MAKESLWIISLSAKILGGCTLEPWAIVSFVHDDTFPILFAEWTPSKKKIVQE